VVHLIICLADHFEPAIVPQSPGNYASRVEQERRLEQWCRRYPELVDRWRDSDGFPFRHTYFFPAEQYDSEIVERLAKLCRAGWGEIEIHLHHGITRPDTSENTRRVLLGFRDSLVERHGCLSRFDGEGPPRYAFVHGNWALANSGCYCGVDNEMQILSETGCYADLTLPSAPNPAQTAKINALYECALPLEHRVPHRRGRDLRVGRIPKTLPLIIQGPLLLGFTYRGLAWPRFYIENSAVTSSNPATMRRLRLWRGALISVQGRTQWIFIKLHCHGMDPRDEPAMLGEPMREFIQELTSAAARESGQLVHFVTAREMVNIALAACDGRDGNPGIYRDYRLRLITPACGPGCPISPTSRQLPSSPVEVCNSESARG
jgi:hypothetical protein